MIESIGTPGARYAIWNDAGALRIILMHDGAQPGELVVDRVLLLAGDGPRPKPAREEVEVTVSTDIGLTDRLAAAAVLASGDPLQLPSVGDEVLAKLPDLLKGEPKGVPVKAMATALAADQQSILRAMKALHEEGRAVLFKQRAKTGWRLLPAGASAPAVPDFSVTQDRVYQLLSDVAGATGLVRKRSYGDLAKVLSLSTPSVKKAIEVLIVRGRVQVVTPGSGRKPTTYRLLGEVQAA